MKITHIRLDEPQGHEALEKYIFGGHYGPMRVPRGIAPELVTKFIRENVATDADAEDLQKALEVMRFYESAQVLPHFAPNINRAPADRDGFRRQAVTCQMFGDLGQQTDAEHAANHFNQHLAPLPDAILLSSLTLETLLTLAPAGTLQPFEAQVKAEVSRLAPAQRSSEEAMMAYDKIAAIQRNEIPRTRKLIELKKTLLLQKPPERRHPVVELYLGRSKINDLYLQNWAARLLRQEAMASDPRPLWDEFGKMVDEVPIDALGKDPKTDALLLRAAHALEYLEGPLTVLQREKMSHAKTATIDFLDDHD
jgi:hypothetical protein